MTGPVPVRGIRQIEPYVGGKAHVPGIADVIKLSSNESPLGPSDAALEAYRAAASGLAIYPEGTSALLREAIGEVYGLNPDRIVCGCGSDELLHLLPYCYLAPGDEAVMSAHAFAVYRIATLAAGGTPVIVPEPDRIVSVDAMIGAIGPKTRMVFLANPNNPTGSYLPIAEVRRLAAAVPRNAILVLDAAYAEYVRRNDYESGIEIVSSAENVVMTRTFSKIHALAGLRVGWLYGPAAIIETLNRVRPPFNVNIPAQAAAAAALRDKAHIEASIAHNDRWLPVVAERLRAAGLACDPSVGNFLLVHFPDHPGKRAPEADAFLQGRGLILRRMDSYGFPNALRLTIGTGAANERVVAALEDFMKRP